MRVSCALLDKRLILAHIPNVRLGHRARSIDLLCADASACGLHSCVKRCGLVVIDLRDTHTLVILSNNNNSQYDSMSIRQLRMPPPLTKRLSLLSNKAGQFINCSIVRHCSLSFQFMICTASCDRIAFSKGLNASPMGSISCCRRNSSK